MNVQVKLREKYKSDAFKQSLILIDTNVIFQTQVNGLNIRKGRINQLEFKNYCNQHNGI